MKKTMRTMVPVMAGMLATAAMAQAQPAPPPAAAPAGPGASPLPDSAATSTSATASPGSQPPADTTAPTSTAPEKKPNPWFFTRFNWGNSAGTKLLGVGGDFLGTDDQQYLMSFGLNARYYVLNESTDKFYVNVNAGFSVELTNSDSTSSKYEPQWNDTILGVGYTHTAYKNADKSLSLTPLVTANAIVPTSKESWNQGRYLSTSLGAGLIALLPVAGSHSDWFTDVYGIASLGWSHSFTKATTAAVPDGSYVNRIARTAPDGTEYRSDQLAGGMLTHDRLRMNVTYFLTVYKDLSFNNTWEIMMPFKYAAPATNVSTPTGSVMLPEGATAMNPLTTFDVGFSYTLFNMSRIDIGYTNSSLQLVDNGGARYSVFYSPSAIFYGNVSVFLDTLIDKAMNPADPKKTKPVDSKKLAMPGRFNRVSF